MDRSPHGFGVAESIVREMRDFIFIGILLAMALLAVWHVTAGSWAALSIDGFVAWVAFRAWNPRRTRRR